MGSDYMAYDGAVIGLMGITLIPLTVLTTKALVQVKGGDPARSAFRHMKIAFVFLTWGTILVTAYMILHFVRRFLLSANPTSSEAEIHLANVGFLLQSLAQCAILSTLVELGAGILMAKTSRRSQGVKAARMVARGFAGLLGLLLVVIFIMIIAVNIAYKSGNNTDSTDNASRALQKMSAAVVILLFVASVVVAGFAIRVMIQVNSSSQARKASIFLIACSLLWLARNISTLSMMLTYNGLFVKASFFRPIWIGIVDVILDQWVTVALLVTLFVLAIKKTNGLWSTPFKDEEVNSANVQPHMQQPY